MQRDFRRLQFRPGSCSMCCGVSSVPANISRPVLCLVTQIVSPEIADRREDVHGDTDAPNRQTTASTCDVQVVSVGRLDLLQRDGKFTPSFARLHIFRDFGGGVLWCAVVLATLASR